MVKCGRSEDGYLLAIVSLIIFKVLDGYAAIARQSPNLKQDIASRKAPLSSRLSLTVSLCTSSSDHDRSNPVVVGKYCFNGTDSARMAAQLVLSELYLVRRLVEQLSTKLQEHGGKTGERRMIRWRQPWKRHLSRRTRTVNHPHRCQERRTITWALLWRNA